MKIDPYSRRKQILATLHEHGPLSTSGLYAILEPKMEKRRIQDSVKRLKDHGYIINRFDSLPEKTVPFWQISYNEKTLDQTEKILGHKLNSALKYSFRSQDLAHSQLCAVLATRLQKQLPNSKIVREHHFDQHERIAQVLLKDIEDSDFDPDIFILTPSSTGNRINTVAVEMEQVFKSEIRVSRRLKRYATQCLVDGVVYVCRDEALLERVYRSYVKSVLPKASRIKHYEDHFLLLCTLEKNINSARILCFNSKLENVPLDNWITTLSNIPNSKRDSNCFKPSALMR